MPSQETSEPELCVGTKRGPQLTTDYHNDDDDDNDTHKKKFRYSEEVVDDEEVADDDEDDDDDKATEPHADTAQLPWPEGEDPELLWDETTARGYILGPDAVPLYSRSTFEDKGSATVVWDPHAWLPQGCVWKTEVPWLEVHG